MEHHEQHLPKSGGVTRRTFRFLIVDPHQLAREGLRLRVAGDAYEVVSATPSLEAALPEIESELRPRPLVLVLEDSGDTFLVSSSSTPQYTGGNRRRAGCVASNIAAL